MIQLLHTSAKTLAGVATLTTLSFTHGTASAQGTRVGQSEPPKPPTLPAARTTQAPVLDGMLDEPVWRTTQASDAFTQKFPAPGQPANEPTTVRILYDDEAIYIGIVCTQARSIITRRLTRRDRPIETDSVTVAFDLVSYTHLDVYKRQVPEDAAT